MIGMIVYIIYELNFRAIKGILQTICHKKKALGLIGWRTLPYLSEHDSVSGGHSLER